VASELNCADSNSKIPSDLDPCRIMESQMWRNGLPQMMEPSWPPDQNIFLKVENGQLSWLGKNRPEPSNYIRCHNAVCLPCLVGTSTPTHPPPWTGKIFKGVFEPDESISQLGRANHESKQWCAVPKWKNEKAGDNQKKSYSTLKPLLHDIVLYLDSDKKKRVGIILELCEKNQVIIRSVLYGSTTTRKLHIRVCCIGVGGWFPSWIRKCTNLWKRSYFVLQTKTRSSCCCNFSPTKSWLLPQTQCLLLHIFVYFCAI
jgi:hypothetical protein